MPPRQKPADRDKVTAAIARLRNLDDPQAEAEADAVQYLADIAVPGWAARPPEGINVSFHADKDLMARVTAKAGRGKVSGVAVDGARRVMAGEIPVRKTVRGDADSKTKVNIRVPEELDAELKAWCAAAKDELGWTVRPVNVYVAAFERFAPAPQE